MLVLECDLCGARYDDHGGRGPWACPQPWAPDASRSTCGDHGGRVERRLAPAQPAAMQIQRQAEPQIEVEINPVALRGALIGAGIGGVVGGPFGALLGLMLGAEAARRIVP